MIYPTTFLTKKYVFHSNDKDITLQTANHTQTVQHSTIRHLQMSYCEIVLL